jgi:AAA domain
MNGLKITRLRVVNFRGVEAVDLPIGLHGSVVSGPNASGKTSLLRAIRAALAGQDIGPDAIRIGEKRAEILVDMSHVSVRRVITPEETSVEVKDGGKKIPSPQKWLKELLGTSPLDPLDFYKGDKAARRRALLAAVPLALPANTLSRVPPALLAEFPEVAALAREGGHALALCSAIGKVFFDARTETNRSLKAYEQQAEEILSPGPLIPPGKDPRPALENARVVLLDFERQAQRASSSEEARAKTRARIAELRAQGENARNTHAVGPLPEDVAAKAAAVERASVALASAERDHLEQAENVRVLREKLAALVASESALALARERASTRLAEARAAHAAIAREVEGAEEASRARHSEAEGLFARAAELEATIAAAEDAPEPGEVTAQAGRVAQLEAKAKAFAEASARQEAFSRAQKAGTEVRKRSDALSAMVDLFREELPKSLIAADNGIEGLSLVGDSILLDGVDIDHCSGMEQIEFAVEIARRANAKSRILIVDGLEALDHKQYEAFVRSATRDGYQLIASRVDDRDEWAFEAIEIEEEAT